MDKILNDIEHKLKEAADKVEVPYYEKAWQKMEALLDKDRHRRRPLLWFLLAVLIAGGLFTYILINRNPAEKDKTAAAVKETSAGSQKITNGEIVPEDKNGTGIGQAGQLNDKSEQPATLPGAETAAPTGTKIPPDNSNKIAGTGFGAENKIVKQKTGFSESRLSQKKKSQPFISANKNAGIDDKKMSDEHKGRRNKRNAKGIAAANIKQAAAEVEKEVAIVMENPVNKETIPQIPATEAPSEKEILPEEKIIKTPDSASIPTKPIANPADPVQLANQPAEKKEKLRKPGLFFFALYGGVGSDPVRAFNFSKENPFVPKYGLAAGYSIGKRSAVTIGFNVHRKKYTADTTSYKTKGSSYFSYYKVSEIEAVCRVYEIPLMFHYNIGNSKKYNYFISGGLASFIMQKEDYDYYFYYGGAMRNRHATYTKNSHLFASALLGAVVERNISKQFALQLSPAFAVPLKGIGQGEVKLYSAQLLFGLKYTVGGK